MTAWGYRRYRQTDRTPPVAYSAMRKLFAADPVGFDRLVARSAARARAARRNRLDHRHRQRRDRLGGDRTTARRSSGLGKAAVRHRVRRSRADRPAGAVCVDQSHLGRVTALRVRSRRHPRGALRPRGGRRDRGCGRAAVAGRRVAPGSRAAVPRGRSGAGHGRYVVECGGRAASLHRPLRSSTTSTSTGCAFSRCSSTCPTSMARRGRIRMSVARTGTGRRLSVLISGTPMPWSKRRSAMRRSRLQATRHRLPGRHSRSPQGPTARDWEAGWSSRWSTRRPCSVKRSNGCTSTIQRPSSRRSCTAFHGRSVDSRRPRAETHARLRRNPAYDLCRQRRPQLRVRAPRAPWLTRPRHPLRARSSGSGEMQGRTATHFQGYFHRLKMLGSCTDHDWLFLCDSYGAFRNGTYYTGEHGDLFVERAMLAIIDSVIDGHGYDPAAIVTIGFVDGGHGRTQVRTHAEPAWHRRDRSPHRSGHLGGDAGPCRRGVRSSRRTVTGSRRTITPSRDRSDRSSRTGRSRHDLPDLFMQTCADDVGVYAEQVLPLADQWRAAGGIATLDVRPNGGHTSDYATRALLLDAVDALLAGKIPDVAKYQGGCTVRRCPGCPAVESPAPSQAQRHAQARRRATASSRTLDGLSC